MLVLPPAFGRIMEAHAAGAAPAEACGLLIGAEADGVQTVDGVRTGLSGTPSGYTIAAADFMAAETAARARGAFVCGVYHSHPRGPATPSALDRALAWPGFDYVILPGDGSAMRAWRLRDDRSGFDETPLVLDG